MSRDDSTKVKIINQHGPIGFVMFVAWVGAFVYFLHYAKDFGGVVLAFLEACVWPAIAVYHVLRVLGA